MIWLLGVIIFIYVLYATLWVIGLVGLWIYNGFSIRRTREYIAFCDEMEAERQACKRREDQKQHEEWLRKRRERLGW